MTSLFGLVLAIGIVVDDAIVVVEAAQRHIDEGADAARGRHPGHGGSVRSGGSHRLHPVGGIHPGGLPGRHQRTDLQAVRPHHRRIGTDLGFQRAVVEPRTERHAAAAENADARPAGSLLRRLRPRVRVDRAAVISAGVGGLIRKSALAMLGLFCFWFAAGWLFRQLPTSFLPDEDQGTIYVTVRLPDAASVERTNAATARSEEIVSKIPGRIGHVHSRRPRHLHPHFQLECRHADHPTETVGRSHHAEQEFARRFANISADSRVIPEAVTNAFGQPPIQGLSTTGGFQFMLEDRTGVGVEDLAQAADLTVQAARATARDRKRGQHLPLQCAVLQGESRPR